MANEKSKSQNQSDEKKDNPLTDTLKKIISSGSPTEISKEILGTVVGQVLKTKDDITLKATNEMIALIQKIDFVKEFSKFAENHKFKVSAEIEIIKKEEKK
ncbi:MAG: hypothetical protein ACK4VO_08250 [Pseudobdellovibrio sp.]